MLSANEGKSEVIKVGSEEFKRLPIKTHVVTADDNIEDVAYTYAKEFLQDGDILFISEKAVSCSQKRAIPLKDIHPRKLAKFLTRFVYKSPYGIGLGIPETMEMALRECGTPRILFAAFCSAAGKLIGKRGIFYDVAGYRAKSIDGPTPYTLPPYNTCVVLGPLNPDAVAKKVADKIGQKCVVVDINDLAGEILGASDSSIDRAKLVKILKDNPLGQSGQQTPMGIIRKI